MHAACVKWCMWRSPISRLGSSPPWVLASVTRPPSLRRPCWMLPTLPSLQRTRGTPLGLFSRPQGRLSYSCTVAFPICLQSSERGRHPGCVPADHPRWGCVAPAGLRLTGAALGLAAAAGAALAAGTAAAPAALPVPVLAATLAYTVCQHQPVQVVLHSGHAAHGALPPNVVMTSETGAADGAPWAWRRAVS